MTSNAWKKLTIEELGCSAGVFYERKKAALGRAYVRSEGDPCKQDTLYLRTPEGEKAVKITKTKSAVASVMKKRKGDRS
jgi:hypothetical protein